MPETACALEIKNISISLNWGCIEYTIMSHILKPIYSKNRMIDLNGYDYTG